MEQEFIIPTEWSDLIGQYIDLVHDGLEDMAVLNLIMYIKDSGLTTNLFASRYINSLIVSNRNPIEPFNKALHIHYKTDTETLAFKYYRDQSEVPVFEMEYSELESDSKFKAFVKNIGWE